MSFNPADLRTRVVLNRNFVTQQNLQHVSRILDTANLTFDAARGYGNVTGASSAFNVNSGGFDNQQVTCVMRYVVEVAGNQDLGVLLRVQTMHTTAPDVSSYYYARVTGGQARIVRVLNGAFTTLTSAAFTPAQDTDITITFSAIGTALAATFVSGANNASLSTTDANIPATLGTGSGGIVGARCGPGGTLPTFRVQTMLVEEVQ